MAASDSASRLLESFQTLWRAYRIREAEALLPAMLETADLSATQLLGVANALYNAGRFESATFLTGRAHRLTPEDPRVRLVHAEMLERCGSFSATRETLAPLLKANQPRAMRLEAHLLRREGSFAKAAELLERQLADHPSDEDWRLQYELAAIYDRLGQYEKAMIVLLRAKEALEPAAAPHYNEWLRLSSFQWELTRSIQPEQLQRWISEPVSATEPSVCLVPGFPRSGTTLLETILCCHPDCVGTDESQILANQFRDDLIFAAPSPTAALVDLDSFHTDDLQAGREEYFRCTAEFTGRDLSGKRIIEKEPLLTADLPLPLRLFPGCRVLMPLRDPRDILVSFFFTIVPLNWSSAPAISLAESAHYYARTMRHWLHLREMLPQSSWLESRYEDLIAAPESQIRRLCAFLDLELVTEMFAHHRKVGSQIARTPTYDDVRHALHPRAIGRWENYAQWIEPHFAVLEPVMKALGYPV